METKILIALVAISSVFGLAGCKPKQATFSPAEKTLIEKAKRGDAVSQDSLGLLYLKGQGVRKDESEAVKWFQQAAEQGNAEAQNHLGYCYAAGSGASQSYEEAEKWWRKAADQGNPDAEFNLGQSFYSGLGVEKNNQEAVKWYRAAAEQGYARAQYNLGICYDEGIAVAKNEVEAVRWYRRAAEQGDASAQYALATKYDAGQGIGQDSIEAYKWYSLALANRLNQSQMEGVRNVVKEATQNFKRLKSRMDPSQIQEAQRRVRTFVPRTPSVVAPTESMEKTLFIDPSGSFEIHIDRILIGQRAVDENVIYQSQLDDIQSRNKEIVYFEISLKNINGPQERNLFPSDFSLQDKSGNTYSSEMTSDYIHGSVLRGNVGHGGIAFAVENGSIPTTLTYDTGYVYAGTGTKIFAKANLDKLTIFRFPLNQK